MIRIGELVSINFDQAMISLLSGLIGAVIGAVIASITTFLTTRYSLNKTYEKSLNLEAKKRSLEKSEQIGIAKDALLTEAKENKELIDKWSKHRGKFKFVNDAWTAYKSSVPAFPKGLQEKLLIVYSRISRVNTEIEYDYRTPFGSGVRDAEIERRVGEVSKVLDDLLGQFSVVPPVKPKK